MQLKAKEIPPVIQQFLLDLLKTSVKNLITRLKENRKAGELLRLLSHHGTEDEKETFEKIINNCKNRYFSTGE